MILPIDLRGDQTTHRTIAPGLPSHPTEETDGCGGSRKRCAMMCFLEHESKYSWPFSHCRGDRKGACVLSPLDPKAALHHASTGCSSSSTASRVDLTRGSISQ